MLGMKEQFIPILEGFGIEVFCPEFLQTMSEEELCELVPQFDGWIIGDDPATERVFEHGASGKLKAAVKWGVGVDNVDFDACEKLGVSIQHTPGMFGREVADIALGYVIGLARETYLIDREVRKGNWPKPRGVSLSGRTVGIVGHGDIGLELCKRLLACGMNVITWDPAKTTSELDELELAIWPNKISQCDFLVFTCSLNANNFHMFNEDIVDICKTNVRVINVARGGLISESALLGGLNSGKIHSAALDVFETEPLAADHPLLNFERCILGSHNASNSNDAVVKTNARAIGILLDLLGVSHR